MILALLYPVQFEEDPVNGVDRALEVVVAKRALNASADEYSSAVKRALASPEDLAPIIPSPHDDATIRRYLREVHKRLTAA